MRRMFRGLSIGVLSAIVSQGAMADIVKARLTNGFGIRNYESIVTRLSALARTNLTLRDFALAEDFSFAGMRVQTLRQMREGKPIEGTALRIWLTPQGGFIVAEGHFDKPSNKHNVPAIMAALRRYLRASYLDAAVPLSAQSAQVIEAVRHHHDPVLGGYTHKDVWVDYDFQRVFTGTGRRGTHEVRFSHRHQRVVGQDYRAFERGELEPIAARGYKLFERHWFRPGEVQVPEELELKYLNDETVALEQDPFAALTTNPWLLLENAETRQQLQLDPAEAKWTFAQLEALLTRATSELVKVPNGFTGPQGLVLDGRYVNVTVHPEARGKVADPGFPWRYSGQLDARQARTGMGAALVMATNLRPGPFKAPVELMEVPVRDVDNKFETLIPRPADQVQVYWAVTEMMDQLRQLGFNDPEISTRKFTAVMYNPDPFFQDNAFYVSDTINFTKYSAGQPNFARDNTVIWHELGHGIVDRICGPGLVLAKERGFGEGMADFLAELVLQASSFQREFAGRTKQRIYNRTPFNLSSEEHDGGEAFGGVMKDILDQAISRWGRAGLEKVADLTLETMRFIRNHPGLTEQEWIEKLRFTDSRASSKRVANELAPLITKALAGRNFAADTALQARALLKIDGREPQRGEASFNRPLETTFGVARPIELSLSLVDGESYSFSYPLRVFLRSDAGAAGPVDWVNEDAGPQVAVLNAAGDEAKFLTGTTGQCDVLNAALGCLEGLVVDVFPAGATRPLLRKRVFVQVRPSLPGPVPGPQFPAAQ